MQSFFIKVLKRLPYYIEKVHYHTLSHDPLCADRRLFSPFQMDNWRQLPEERFPSLAVYNVNDSPAPDFCDNRAAASLPPNLTIRRRETNAAGDEQVRPPISI